MPPKLPRSLPLDLCLAANFPYHLPNDPPLSEQESESMVYHPDISLRQAIMLWSEASHADLQVAAREGELVRHQTCVDDQRARLGELRAQTKTLRGLLQIEAPTRNGVVRRVLRRNSPRGAPTQQMEDDALARTRAQLEEVTAQMEAQERLVADSEHELQNVQDEVASLRWLAASMDDRFVQVRDAAHESQDYCPNATLAIERAEDELIGHEAAFQEATDTLAAISRAKVVLQHGHHYFSQVLRLYDAFGVDSSTFGVETDRMNILKNAIRTSIKVQALLNEGLRVLRDLEPRVIPPDSLSAINTLRSLGVLQTTRVFNLFYGGSSLAAAVRSQLVSLTKRQDQAFAALTVLVVWVQKRDASRRALIALWESEDDGRRASILY